MVKKHALDHKDPITWTQVSPGANRSCFNCRKRENESLSECIRHFMAAREILYSCLGGPILAVKAAKDDHHWHVQLKDSNEGGLDLFLG